MVKVTKTTNKLPFNVLSYERFEDLCMLVIYRLRQWFSIQHFGRKGKDGGVDIYAELIENKILKHWFIQCKRYSKISKKQLEEIITDVVEKNKVLPDKYILILSCDISKTHFEYFRKICEKKGITDSDVIGASRLEALLYTGHPDILKIYFDIDLLEKRVRTVTRIKRRLAMKKNFESHIHNMNGNEVIVRDINRVDIYPEIDVNTPGISSWFKLEFYRTYHRGISFYTSIVKIWINKKGQWLIGESKKPKGSWEGINAYVIADIPYDNIVAIDYEGDGYYPFTHIYCEFSNAGEPYEKIWYAPTNEYKNKGYKLSEKLKIK